MCPKQGVCGEIRLFVAKFGHFCGEKRRFTGLIGRFSLILEPKNELVFDSNTEFDMKKSSFTTPIRLVIIAVMLFSTMVCTQAQTFLGTAGDGLWSNVDNWLDGLKPTEMFAEVTVSADVIVDENVSIGTLNNAGDYTLTVLAGKTLIVNSVINWGDNDFILEDKAELVYREPVQVTIKKNISAYDENSHLWELIASPVREDVVPSTENGFLTEPETGYALFSYDENTAKWINYKESPFAIESGKSYLYSNALDTTLLFEGTTMGHSTQCDLSYHAENGIYAGYNFIGNPLSCDAYLNRSYYILSEESNSLIAVPNSATKGIAPCTGIIVNSENPDDNDVSFSYMPFFQYLGYQGYIEITVAKNNAPTLVLDQALLSFNAGDDLAKFSLFENAPRAYFTKDNHELAILSIDSTDMQPFKFKVAEDGSYTLNFELKDLNLNYLHLIDNITGTNVDLLSSPNYTFNASTSDYVSRFKLVFDPHYGVEEYENNGFAYYANGEIIINYNNIETQSIASLQVCDLTGRVVFCRDAVRHVSTYGMSPGVYVLRLKTQNEVRTQKIIIE